MLGGFGAASTYTLYLAALLSESTGGGGPPALSTLWRGARLPAPAAVDGLVATLCGGCCVFYAAFATDLVHALVRPVRARLFPSLLFPSTSRARS